MKNIFIVVLLGLVAITGCSRDELTLQIVRTPLIKFDLDADTFTSETYFFTGPVKVVAYPSNPTLPGVLYNRYTLQAAGKDSKGNSLQFNMSLDASDASLLTGLYRVPYTAERGLQQVQLFQVGNTLAAYTLCAGDSVSPSVQIAKQSNTERLISGTFQMTLCNTRDTTQKIRIRNGILNDINY